LKEESCQTDNFISSCVLKEINGKQRLIEDLKQNIAKDLEQLSSKLKEQWTVTPSNEI